MGWIAGLGLQARRLQWERGLRAGVAVGTAMVVSHELGRPFGWAAFGAFMAILVDNGGPYRTRLTTMAMALGGGAVASMLGALVGSGTLLPAWLPAVLGATSAVCFVITFARVLAQPFASTSVMVLVTYFAGLGGAAHTFAGARAGAEMLVLGGLWAAALSLLLWPLDAFRPARLAVAACYESLAEFTGLLAVPANEEELEQAQVAAGTWRRHHRTLMEAARSALVSTSARAPSRSVRARNLTVLLETAEMLYATAIRMTEMAGLAGRESEAGLHETVLWLSRAENALGTAIRDHPADGGASFAAGGSHRLDLARRKEVEGGRGLGHYLAAEERDAALEVEICYEALRALWNGVDSGRAGADASVREQDGGPGWLDEVKANWTLRSAMLRHALRIAVVGAVDVGLMHVIRVNHGFWLAMTSIIVLQPGAGTVRKGLQRVGGTIAGGIVAALLAVLVRGQVGIIAVITVCAVLTLATYAVDYGWYCFFLTPTFVLMSLPHPRDWKYAGVRMGTTVVGACVAIVAMRLLWPERTAPEVGRLLARGAAADAAYLRAVVRFWTVPETGRREAQRSFLGAARRACGLASNEAEEVLDRLLGEPAFGKKEVVREEVLRFTTYLRRLTQSATALAVVGRATKSSVRRVEGLAERLERLASGLTAGTVVAGTAEEIARPMMVDLAEDQMARLERQVQVLEKAGAGLESVERSLAGV